MVAEKSKRWFISLYKLDKLVSPADEFKDYKFLAYTNEHQDSNSHYHFCVEYNQEKSKDQVRYFLHKTYGAIGKKDWTCREWENEFALNYINKEHDMITHGHIDDLKTPAVYRAQYFEEKNKRKSEKKKHPHTDRRRILLEVQKIFSEKFFSVPERQYVGIKGSQEVKELITGCYLDYYYDNDLCIKNNYQISNDIENIFFRLFYKARQIDVFENYRKRWISFLAEEKF